MPERAKKSTTPEVVVESAETPEDGSGAPEAVTESFENDVAIEESTDDPDGSADCSGPPNVPDKLPPVDLDDQPEEDSSERQPLPPVPVSDKPTYFLGVERVVFEQNTCRAVRAPGGDFEARLRGGVKARGNSYQEALDRLQQKVGRQATTEPVA